MDTQSFVGATETTASPTKHSKGHSDKSAELSPRKSLKKQKSMESPRTVVASETLSSPTKHSKAHPERSNESSPRKSPKKQKSMDSPRKTVSWSSVCLYFMSAVVVKDGSNVPLVTSLAFPACLHKSTWTR